MNNSLRVQQLANSASTSHKRKPDTRNSGRSQKRTKGVQDISNDADPGIQSTTIDDLDILSNLEEGKRLQNRPIGADVAMIAGVTLSGTLFASHKLLMKHDVDGEAISFNLVKLLGDIVSVISTIAKHHDELAKGSLKSSVSLEKDGSELAHAVRASARAFTSVLVGLGKISGNDMDGRFPNLVVYECVVMFKKIFETITESARQTMAKRLASQKIKAKAKGNPRREPTLEKASDPPRTIAQFVRAIIAYLDKSDPLHRDIFEGFLFILLERVGKRLYYCTFGRERSATIAGDIKLPLHGDHPDVIAREEVKSQAARLEVRSLVEILERAIGLAPYHINTWPSVAPPTTRRQNTTRLARSLTLKTLPPGSKAPLSAQARDRLQRTLIACMFGQEDGDDFSEVLRMPARLGTLPAVKKMDEKDTNEWFEGEVWRLVGWGLLGREGAW